MDNAALARYIDLTMLKPEATFLEIEALCAKAIDIGAYAVCVNPSRVGLAAKQLRDTNVLPISVVGFPLGATHSMLKVFEVADAIENGAREIDMVINLGALKDGYLDAVKCDIRDVVEACEGMPLKVILETAVLTQHEILSACRLAEEAGAQFVKTSTGMHKAGGATFTAVRVMRKAVGDRLGVKASGGIRTRADALNMITAGASRIGVSDVSEILV